jgi:hypothetical protein
VTRGQQTSRRICFFLWQRERKSRIKYIYFFSVRKRIISAVKKVEFLSDMLSYIILRGRRSDVTVLNVRAPTEDKLMI